MEKSENLEPMHRRKHFDFDTFDRLCGRLLDDNVVALPIEEPPELPPAP